MSKKAIPTSVKDVKVLSEFEKLRFKDVIKIALILTIVLVASMTYSYFVYLPNFELFAYGIAICFLVWFATRRNGCGSCNKISKKSFKIMYVV